MNIRRTFTPHNKQSLPTSKDTKMTLGELYTKAEAVHQSIAQDGFTVQAHPYDPADQTLETIVRQFNVVKESASATWKAQGKTGFVEEATLGEVKTALAAERVEARAQEQDAESREDFHWKRYAAADAREDFWGKDSFFPFVGLMTAGALGGAALSMQGAEGLGLGLITAAAVGGLGYLGASTLGVGRARQDKQTELHFHNLAENQRHHHARRANGAELSAEIIGNWEKAIDSPSESKKGHFTLEDPPVEFYLEPAPFIFY